MEDAALDAQTEWAYRLLESLVEAGVRDAVISPGSRSTPLTWAALETPGLRCHSVIDERSASFFALGQARVSGRPSLLVCTSGSAGANYYPAVIEAAQSGVPLIVLTADRPFELMHCGAQQTIDQTRLFGQYAAFVELGTPTASEDALLALRRQACQAVEHSLTPGSGPVQLNFRARKPLEPRAARSLVRLPGTGAAAPPAPAPLPSERDVRDLSQALAASRCPIVLAGAAMSSERVGGDALARFVRASGAWLVPETASQLRLALPSAFGASDVGDAFEWLIEDRTLSQRLQPDLVLQLGGSPMSTAIQQFLRARRATLPLWICATRGWPDPSHQAARIVRADAEGLLEALTARLGAPSREASDTGRLLRSANELVWQVLGDELGGAFGEAVVVRSLCDHLPQGSLLVVGNSLPPRHLDRYCRARDRSIRVCSQRGASGIEGGFAGALGAASCHEGATTLLLGDVAALHDIGSLWAADAARTHGPALRHPLVAVVMNNGGGRIFEQLPIAQSRSPHLRFWTTPHALTLEGVAQSFGVPYVAVRTADELTRALTAGYERAGFSLIEVLLPGDEAQTTLVRLRRALVPRLAELAERPS